MKRKNRCTEATREKMLRSEDGTLRPLLALEGILWNSSFCGNFPSIASPPLALEGVLRKLLLRGNLPSVATLRKLLLRGNLPSVATLRLSLALEASLWTLWLRDILPRPLLALSSLEGIRVANASSVSHNSQKLEFA